MTKKFKLKYELNDVPSRSFITAVPVEATCSNFLQTMSEKLKKKYVKLFCGDIEINNDDIVFNIMNKNHDCIFTLYLDPTPRSQNEPIDEKKLPLDPPPLKTNKTSSPALNASQTTPSFTDSENQINKSVIKRDSTSEHEDLQATELSLTFKCTGGDINLLTNGIQIKINKKVTPEQCRKVLFEALSEKVDIDNKTLLIYLQGGIPFIGGTLGDIYTIENCKFIYGVLTRSVDECDLTDFCPELCDMSSPKRRLFLSPLCDSTERGLSDIACLMGYINHDGFISNDLLCAFASVINFPPLLTSMKKIMKRDQVVYRDLITVCSTLFTFFRAKVSENCKDNQVFEKCLHLCDSIINFSDYCNDLPLNYVEFDPVINSPKWISDLKLNQSVYMWDGVKTEFDDKHFIKFDPKIDNEKKDKHFCLSPISPYLMDKFTSCCIVKGKDHEYLYIMPSPMKVPSSQRKFVIIDPMTGKSGSYDIKEFAKKEGFDVNDLFNPSEINQILMFVLYEPRSTQSEIEDDEKIKIAHQYLNEYLARSDNYQLQSLQSLLLYDGSTIIKSPFTVFASDILDDKNMTKIKCTSYHGIFDLLLRSCDEISHFKKNIKGQELYPEAQSRIIIISAGKDINSHYPISEVVKDLLKNKIIVENIIIGSNEEYKKLCAVSHITGGFSLHYSNLSEEGVELSSQFINLDERRFKSFTIIEEDHRRITNNRLKLEQITEDFIQDAEKYAEFDKEINNNELVRANSPAHLTKPLHICYVNVDLTHPHLRQRRILKELYYATEIDDPSSPRFDADMTIYTLRSNFDCWKVFIKGPIGTPYENKWWFIYVTFPSLYPLMPPKIRFISVPFHLNVSPDGIISLNYIQKAYMPSKHVVDILYEIKELFIIPDLNCPLSSNALNIFLNSRDQYELLARESSEKNAANDYMDYISRLKIWYEVPDDFKIEFSAEAPQYLTSQISGEVIDKKRLVLASTGVYYDKEELKQLFASNDDPICIITGKHLTKEGTSDLI